jgi:hypothetical protein
MDQNNDLQKEEKTPVRFSKIEEAKQLVERQEKANAEHRELLEREEALQAEKMLSGTASAGQPSKTPEELKKDEAQRMADEITGAFRL